MRKMPLAALGLLFLLTVAGCGATHETTLVSTTQGCPSCRCDFGPR